MRIFRILAVVMALTGLMGCVASSNVAVVNPTRLFQDSESGKAGIEHLKGMEAAMQEQLVTAQGALEQSPNDEGLRARFQQIFVGYQQLVSTEQQKVVEGVNSQIQKVLDAYRAQKRMVVIMNSESVLTYAPNADVTNDIIAEMNKTPVAFTPVSLPPLDVKPTAGKPAASTKAPAKSAPRAAKR